MEQWWYLDNGNPTGPVDLSALRGAVQQGKLDRQSLVWQDGMPQWCKAGEVEKISRHLFPMPPPPPPVSNAPPVPTLRTPNIVLEERTVDDAQTGSKPAWRRFAARICDLWISTYACAFILGLSLPLLSSDLGYVLMDPSNGLAFGFVAMVLSFAFDALIYALFGNTPGKALLRIKVTHPDGAPLTFLEYLRRNAKVWASGFGCTIPLITLFTMVHHFKLVKEKGYAGYDDGLYRVQASATSGLRTAVAVFVCLALLSTNVLLQSVQRDDARTFAYGASWTNPVTSKLVKLPAGWLVGTATNDQGDKISTFTHPKDQLTVFFASEVLPEALTAPEYVVALMKALGTTMELQPTGEPQTVNGQPAWTVSGFIKDDPTQLVRVTVIREGSVMWRTVAMRQNGSPDTKVHADIRNVLFSSF